MDKAVLKNVWINLLGLILPTFVSLLTVPAYIKLLGVERYGVISLVWALIGYFSVLDLGMSLATENRIAKARAANEDNIDRIFWSAFWLNLGTGILGGAVIWSCTHFYVSNVLHLAPGFQQEVFASLPWIALAIPVANVGWVFAGALTAFERFRAFNVNETLGTFLFQLLPLACATLWAPTLAVVIPAAVAARLLSVTSLGLVTARALGIRSIRRPERSIVASLFGFGRWAVLQSTAGMVSDTIDRLLVGSLLGARFVAFYTVPQNLVTRMNLLPSAMLRTLFPRMSALGGEEANDMARTALTFLNGIFSPCVIVALFALGPFLSLWISPAFAHESVHVGRILVIGVWFAGQASILRILMFSQAGQAGVAKLGMALLLPFVAMLWFGIDRFGIIGASIVVVARAFIEYLLLLRYSSIRVRPVLADMVVQCALAIVGLLSADTIDGIAGMIIAPGALILASVGWSWCTSPRLRALLRHPQRFFARGLPSVRTEPNKEPVE